MKRDCLKEMLQIHKRVSTVYVNAYFDFWKAEIKLKSFARPNFKFSIDKNIIKNQVYFAFNFRHLLQLL